jgi:putative transcriptional regulator
VKKGDNTLDSESLKGHFLMAMPGLADPNFSMTVTCICEHADLGSVGLIINRFYPMVSCKDLFYELNLETLSDIHSIPVYFGGPVHNNEIFVLHGPPFDWEGCFQVNSTFAMSNTVDLLDAISRGKGPKDYLICMGCAGWGPGQLESEIRQNSWITCPASDSIIFNIPVDEKWNEAMKQVGIDPSVLSNTAGHA